MICLSPLGIAQIIKQLVRGKLLKPVEGGVAEQLRQIALEINSWTLHKDSAHLEQLKQEARKIGEELYKMGGWTLMLRAYHQAGSPKEIEKAWHDIGTWKG